MIYLWLATFIWAFSFPVIGYFVSGQIDSYFAIFVRVFIAFLLFSPFLRCAAARLIKLKFMLIGALQIGVMYVFYYRSFLYLSVSEVALFTIFTPFYVSLFYDLFSLKFRARNLALISLSVAGAFVLKRAGLNDDFWLGFFLIQAANLAFALAQVLFKLTYQKHKIHRHTSVMSYFFLGAMLFSLASFISLGDFSRVLPSTPTLLALLYLGAIASSLGYFCWNKGAASVSAVQLALMNNAIIPVAIFINLVFFKIDINLANLALGSALMLAAALIHHFAKSLFPD